jgi:hypothetical protein
VERSPSSGIRSNAIVVGAGAQGNFVMGKREGLGRMLYPNGPGQGFTVLTGNWENDQVRTPMNHVLCCRHAM